MDEYVVVFGKDNAQGFSANQELIPMRLESTLAVIHKTQEWFPGIKFTVYKLSRDNEGINNV